MLELRLLQSFVTLAEELHFGRAAARLHLSQPPLSAQIKRLEDELGARLFERSNRRVALTEAGEALLVRARALIAEADRTAALIRRVAASDAGLLAIGYTPTATYEVLPPLVRALRKSSPELALELRELTSADQVEALRARRIEVGFLCMPVAALDDPTVATALHVTPIIHEPLVVALPRGHRLAKARAVALKDLAGEPFVAVARDVEPGWAGAVEGLLHQHAIHADVAQTADTKLAMLGLVAAGLGLAIVSRSMSVLARNGVVFRPLTGTRLRLTLALATAARPSPRAARVVALAQTLAHDRARPPSRP